MNNQFKFHFLKYYINKREIRDDERELLTKLIGGEEIKNMKYIGALNNKLTYYANENEQLFKENKDSLINNRKEKEVLEQQIKEHEEKKQLNVNKKKSIKLF